jgi:methionine sulfoxide reductase heme-binding subunit
MNFLDVSSTSALIAFGSITLNLLLGWAIWSRKRNPLPKGVTFLKLHKFTACSAAAFIVLHIALIPLDSNSGFRWVDLLLPLWTKHQPWQYTLGALSFYLIAIVVVSSYYKKRIAYKTWRKLHYISYVATPVLLIHGLFTDSTLKDKPIDFLDGEKVFVEVCAFVLCVLIIYRFSAARNENRRLS